MVKCRQKERDEIVKVLNTATVMEEGKTYWVTVGNDNYPPTSNDLARITARLNNETPYTFIVVPFQVQLHTSRQE